MKEYLGIDIQNQKLVIFHSWKIEVVFHFWKVCVYFHLKRTGIVWLRLRAWQRLVSLLFQRVSGGWLEDLELKQALLLCSGLGLIKRWTCRTLFFKCMHLKKVSQRVTGGRQSFIESHKGEGGVWDGPTQSHKIFEQPLTLEQIWATCWPNVSPTPLYAAMPKGRHH
jgi:hypothetical protein